MRIFPHLWRDGSRQNQRPGGSRRRGLVPAGYRGDPRWATWPPPSARGEFASSEAVPNLSHGSRLPCPASTPVSTAARSISTSWSGDTTRAASTTCFTAPTLRSCAQWPSRLHSPVPSRSGPQADCPCPFIGYVRALDFSARARVSHAMTVAREPGLPLRREPLAYPWCRITQMSSSRFRASSPPPGEVVPCGASDHWEASSGHEHAGGPRGDDSHISVPPSRDLTRRARRSPSPSLMGPHLSSFAGLSFSSTSTVARR